MLSSGFPLMHSSVVFLDFKSKQIYLPFPDIYLAVSVTLLQRNVLKQKQVYDVVL